MILFQYFLCLTSGSKKKYQTPQQTNTLDQLSTTELALNPLVELTSGNLESADWSETRVFKSFSQHIIDGLPEEYKAQMKPE